MDQEQDAETELEELHPPEETTSQREDSSDSEPVDVPYAEAFTVLTKTPCTYRLLSANFCKLICIIPQNDIREHQNAVTNT